MTAFLWNNMGTILTGLILLVILAFAVRCIIRDRKAGKSICGGNCAACAGCAAGRPVSPEKGAGVRKSGKTGGDR